MAVIGESATLTTYLYKSDSGDSNYNSPASKAFVTGMSKVDLATGLSMDVNLIQRSNTNREFPEDSQTIKVIVKEETQTRIVIEPR